MPPHAANEPKCTTPCAKSNLKPGFFIRPLDDADPGRRFFCVFASTSSGVAAEFVSSGAIHVDVDRELLDPTMDLYARFAHVARHVTHIPLVPLEQRHDTPT